MLVPLSARGYHGMVMLPDSSAAVSPDDPAHALLLARRLLACFQQAVGHDLPNQLVAIQGLARLLEQDEAERLSPEGRESLSRLAQLTRRVHTAISALADAGRCCRAAEPVAPCVLAELAREAAAEVSWLHPGREVHFALPPTLPTVTAPPGALRRVLVEVYTFLVRRAPNQPVRIRSEVGAVASGWEVRVAADGAAAAAELQQAFDPFAVPPDEKKPTLGLFLARQLAEGWGGGLRLEPRQGGVLAILTLPATRPPRPVP